MVKDAVILGAVRTPIARGKAANGKLSGVHPVDLLSEVLQAAVDRTGVDPADVDDVIVGCVSQAGEQTLNVARNAVLAAGFPEQVPATTVDRQCGSSQQAAQFAAQGVMAGTSDLVIAAGVESMSRVPMFSPLMNMDPFGPKVAERYAPGLIPQGVSAELIAAKWGLSRRQLDEFATASQQRAAAAADAGHFADEIVPIKVPQSDGSVQEFSADEGIRPTTTVEGLGELKPAFEDGSWTERFPQIDWKVTAGNASQISDGASAVVISSREKAEQLGLRARARFCSFSVVGDDPLLMLTAIIPATRQVLQRANLTVDDIDLFEVNEAFASVVLAWMSDLAVDPDRVNVNGGAIALGHPLGASGTRLLTTLLHNMEQRGARYGLQTMCEGGGMANALVVERLD